MTPRLATWSLILGASLASSVATAAEPPARLELNKGDRIILIGNTLAERMQYFGHFETLLHSRFPDLELVVHDLGWSADELTLRPRSRSFADHGHTLADEEPDVLIAAFGFNESFAGSEGLDQFRKDLEAFIKESTTTKYDGESPPRVVLLSPIAHEDLGDPHKPDGSKTNPNIKLYADAMRQVAHKDGVIFVDLFGPSRKLMEDSKGPLTINGIHLGDEGYRRLSPVLDEALFGPRPKDGKADYEKLRAAVVEKNLQFFYDYRAINGAYIYGGRKAPFGIVNFPLEFARLREMIRRREQRVWDVAQGKSVPATIDDDGAGPLARVESNAKGPIHLTSPEESKRTFTLPEGYEINLFASEVDFPDLKKPVQMTFDAKGRLWVTTMPSYPMYLPGRPVDDKILIFEDTDGDGKADKQTVFADGLHVPTGIELGDGGVYISQQPNIMFLKDEDGDDHADGRALIMHGFDTADSHHAAHAFTWDPGGALYWNEGTFHHSQVETPHGPERVKEAGIFRFEPKTLRFEIFVSYPFANPWGHYVDRWGQNFVADASGGANYFGTAFSGDVDYPVKHGRMEQFLVKQWRPTAGCELVASRHFPDDTQGDYLLNNCIGFQGVLRYRVKEDGSGFKADPVDPLLTSTDPNFRPVDLEFGPDGAFYVVDWYNPLVGHMQHSLRDPNRDVEHGRIWRITAKGRPLVEPAKIAGAPVPDLLELLKTYEDRTRYRVRRELRERPADEVLNALDRWVAGLNKGDEQFWHDMLEALWLHQSLDDPDESLLDRLLSSPEPKARAAAVRVLSGWRDKVDHVMGRLEKAINDPHPRVRLEAVRALSFFEGDRASVARQIANELLQHPTDSYLDYTLNETTRTLDRRSGGARGGDGTLAKLLEGAHLADDRLGTVLEMIGRRGTENDLSAAYDLLFRPSTVHDVADRKALEALVEAARDRGLKPRGNLAEIAPYLGRKGKASNVAVRLAAIRLVGLWKVESLADEVQKIAAAPDGVREVREAALDSLTRLGPAGRSGIDRLANTDRRPEVRGLAIAALARLDLDAAAGLAADALREAKRSEDPEPILAAFLNRQGGADTLAEALGKQRLPADAAKLALRAMYALGRSDASLVTELSRAAGLDAEPKPLDAKGMETMLADVASHGDPKRGEAIFRRADMNCIKCHAIGGAGAEVGPDLAALGSSSPVDYIVNAILVPNQAIKEEFQTLVVLTADGQVVQGIVIDRDENRLILKEATGGRRTIPVADIDDQKEGGSLMPKGLANLMTRDEFIDVVRFLSELGKPGPYAIQATPTVRRWRVLSQPPEDPALASSDPAGFREEVLMAEPSRWAPAFSRVSGALPLDELSAPGSGSRVIYLQGDLDVSREGPVTFRFDSRNGVQVWIDDRPLASSSALTTELEDGHHTLTLRVDTRERPSKELRVEVLKADGSPAEFSVAGGR